MPPAAPNAPRRPAPAPPAGGGGGRKIFGMQPRTAAIVGVSIFAAALAFWAWKRKQSASAANTAVSSSASSYAGTGVDLSSLQDQLSALLTAEGQEPTTTAGGTTQQCPGGFHWDAVQGKCVAGAGEGPVPTGGGTKTKTKPSMPTGVHATKVTSNAVTLAWTKAANATSYRVRVTYQGKLVGSPHTVNGTSATVSGLHPSRTYTFHVAGIGPGGTSAETAGPAVKTSK